MSEDTHTNTYRLNALENLLSKGTVIISVTHEPGRSGRNVLIECVNGERAIGRGNVHAALDVLRLSGAPGGSR